jgi:predicted Rossmann fold nucleotide-binding protein DprA/Smf involved in DNA uptake
MRAFATETSKLEKHIEQNGLAVHKYILDTNPANTWFLDLNRAQKP